MQEPTEEDEEVEAPIPPETVSSAADLDRTVAVRRKAAKRTLPWDLKAGELDLVSTPPQAEVIPARKKPRLEEPFSASTDQAARETASPDVSVGLPPDDVNADPVMDTQPNAWATPVTRRLWTTDEDAKLTSAVANTSKRKWGKEHKTDWPAISELIPGRSQKQCSNRWHVVLDPSIELTNERTGKWAEDEDIKLKAAVQTHGDKKGWDVISAMVPGRTLKQCWNRWHNVLNPSIALTAGRTYKWSEDEDSKLKDAVQMFGGKDWAAISALVPGPSQKQCRNRWYNVLNPSIDRASGSTGKWTTDEDNKLKDSVQTHGGKNWGAIAALVPGRTQKQCCSRWKYALDPSIDRTPPGRTGKF
jgi:hypothetical protein